MKDKIKWFIILHVIIFIFSINSISAKTAAQYDFLSPRWTFFYGIVICILGFYAIAWQQVLKHLPLITTYANKAVTTLWGLLWGYIFFKEKITPIKILASAIVILGVYIVCSSDEEEQKSEDDKEGKDNV